MYIQMKLAQSHTLRQRRLHNKLSKIELAKMVHSSQSRIAKMEAGDPSVSIDLIIKSLLALDASPKGVAKAISAGEPHAARGRHKRRQSGTPLRIQLRSHAQAVRSHWRPF